MFMLARETYTYMSSNHLQRSRRAFVAKSPPRPTSPHLSLLRNLIKTAIWPSLLEPMLHSVTAGQHNENRDVELEMRVRYC